MCVEDGVAVPGAIAGVVIDVAHAGVAESHHLNGRTRHLASGAGGEVFDGFDTDDFRAPIGEVHGAVGAGPDNGDVKDTQALKGEFACAGDGRAVHVAAVCRRHCRAPLRMPLATGHGWVPAFAGMTGGGGNDE